MTFAGCDEAGVDKGLFKDNFLLHVWELFNTCTHHVHVSFNVFREQETVKPNAMALVGPHTNELKGLAFENVRLGVHQVHCDLGEVTQVELVVELAGCGHELWASSDHSENFGGSIDDSCIVTFECAIEIFEVVCEDLTEDSSEDVLFWNT
jgi:hypothetical protein